jgi:hypothetical protein
MGMVFDGSGTLLFGGVQGYYSTLGDTWKLEEGGWFQLAPANSPTPREGPGMAHDAATETVVMFGGSATLFGSCCGDLNETWIWDGTTWTQAFPPVSPPARRFDGQGMAYDAANGNVVLFGGATQSGTVLGDTWTWDGKTRTWTQHFPAASPSARGFAGITYDGETGRVILFGGYDGTKNLADTWAWDGTNWQQRLPATSPPARSGHSLAYDALLKEVVLFSGSGNTDTWVWKSGNWTQVFPATIPHDRYSFGMGYDHLAHSVVIFGGFSVSGGGPILGDTWKLAIAP